MTDVTQGKPRLFPVQPHCFNVSREADDHWQAQYRSSGGVLYSKSKSMVGVMKDGGGKVYLQFEDKGKEIPAFEEVEGHYKYHVVYTSWWRLIFSVPRADGKQVVEHYIQLERGSVGWGNVRDKTTCRWIADCEMLGSEGVDVDCGLTIASPEDEAAIYDLCSKIEHPGPRPYPSFKPSTKPLPRQILELEWSKVALPGDGE